MSFTTGLSGLNAAQNMLAVVGNNIANANTVGFKQSRSEFEDVYATTVAGISKTLPGAGAKVGAAAQQFTQGNLNFTENSLDLAVTGEGFFTLGANLQNTTDLSYSRDGQFHMDSQGHVVNNNGNVLLAYMANDSTNVDAGFSTGLLQPLTINASQANPQATVNVDLSVNLESSLLAYNDPGSLAVAFDPTQPNSTADYQTSVTVYDSMGTSHILSTYYKKVEAAVQPNTWDVWYSVDFPSYGDALPMGSLEFNETGQLTTVTAGGGAITVNDFAFVLDPSDLPTLPSGALFGNTTQLPANSVEIDFNDSTQFGTPSSTNTLSQDGYGTGTLIGVATDEHGVVFARYSNGSSEVLGAVALAKFQNPQGMTKLGDSRWAESTSSGQPVFGEAGKGDFGVMHSGALEGSNVDLAKELVQLIIAQQMYQANSQTIQTQNTIMNTLLQLR